jgi:putative tryptophan/tyrosine transport system substrate-binding protein
MKVVSSQWSVVSKSLFCFGLCALIFSLCLRVDAQQPKKIPRIGIVTGNSNEPSSSMNIFRQTLQELGYSEGKNILFEYRATEGNRDRVPEIVAEVVRLRINILFSTQAIVIRAAKRATKTISIVMAITPDPVAMGLVDSLARPGANITGLTFLTRDLSGETTGITERDDSEALASRNPFDCGLHTIERL